MNATRRDFLGGLLASAGLAGCGSLPLTGGCRPLLRFGVLSDVHIGPAGSDEVLVKELRYLDSQGVEAVLFPGDIANTGIIGEMERFADCWETVFPKCRAADGRRVERLLVTGNHDIDVWPSRWKGWSEARIARERFWYGDNAKRTWERLFGEEWQTVWMRKVKGVVFVGSQWMSLKPPLEKFLAEHEGDIDPSQPFFYCQHPHPKGTCHGLLAADENAEDHGEAVRALSRFGNAVAFSGHSHLPLTDEKAVWQGSFTSIGCGCAGTVATTGFGGDSHVNGGQAWRRADRSRLMPILRTVQNSRAGYVVDVFRDRIILHRHSYFYGCPVGADWCVPLPAAQGGPYDFARRLAAGPAPQFPAGAPVVAEYCAAAPESAGTDYRGKRPCIRVSFPCASAVKGGRVFDYEVKVLAEGGALLTKKMFSPGFHLPDGFADVPGELLFDVDEIPAGRAVRFSVTPCGCYGAVGTPLVSGSFSFGRG